MIRNLNLRFYHDGKMPAFWDSTSGFLKSWIDGKNKTARSFAAAGRFFG
jgi:hypothetical protein